MVSGDVRKVEGSEVIYLTQLVYVHEGQEETFDRVDDAVLRLLSKYRSELLLRLRPGPEAKIDGTTEAPYEVHVVRFETDDVLLRYSNDEGRALRLRWSAWQQSGPWPLEPPAPRDDHRV